MSILSCSPSVRSQHAAISRVHGRAKRECHLARVRYQYIMNQHGSVGETGRMNVLVWRVVREREKSKRSLRQKERARERTPPFHQCSLNDSDRTTCMTHRSLDHFSSYDEEDWLLPACVCVCIALGAFAPKKERERRSHGRHGQAHMYG